MHRGDDAYVRSSLPILKELGFAVDKLTLADAARRYPQIDFDGVKSVWLERRAGALSARRACIAVRDAFVESRRHYRTAYVEPTPRRNDALAGAATRKTAHARSRCLRLRLRSVARPPLPRRPRRRDPSDAAGGLLLRRAARIERYLAGRLPIWIDFGERIIYGIPDVDGRGFKSPTTRAASRSIRPAPTARQREGIARARACSPTLPRARESAAASNREVCQYENSPDGTSSSTAIRTRRTSGSSAAAPATASSSPPPSARWPRRGDVKIARSRRCSASSACATRDAIRFVAERRRPAGWPGAVSAPLRVSGLPVINRRIRRINDDSAVLECCSRSYSFCMFVRRGNIQKL
jgi:hypothetical protein